MKARNPTLSDNVNQFSQLGFKHFGLMDELLKVLNEDLSINTPSPI